MAEALPEPGVPRAYGTLPDGDIVQEIRLAGGGLEVAVLTFGAIIRDLRFEGLPAVLGLDGLADYAGPSPYLGAIAGRFANRIAGGRLPLDGRVHQLSLNEDGRTHLHGGTVGFSRRNWRLLEADGAQVALAYHSPDGEEGYPGTLDARCTYALAGPGTLEITLAATCDAPTVVNLAGHTYFNLDGADSAADHSLTVPAESWLPVDAQKIPTGERRSVAGTPLDFRAPRPVGANRTDHCLVLSEAATAAPRLVARLEGARSGLVLEIESTEPALQVYDGYMLGQAGLVAGGRALGSGAGICLEPQRFPDAPNHQDFPSAVLRPGETYRQVTRYRLSRR